MALVHNVAGPANYGIGDIKLGVKYRFVHETDTVPQIGTFPLVTSSTGSSEKGLGSGQVDVLLPIWPTEELRTVDHLRRRWLRHQTQQASQPQRQLPHPSLRGPRHQGQEHLR